MPAFFIEQFGCRATQADGAALERQLLDRGCTSAPTVSAADIVVVNTCTVTASADAQARDAIRKLHAANPAVRIIATGCYAQRAPEELAALPGVAWVVGNSHKPQIPQLVDSLSTDTERRLAELWADLLHASVTSPEDNFFDLGGHSLLVVLLLVRVQETFGVELSIDDVYSGAITLSSMAERIDTLQAGGPDSSEYAEILREIEEMSDEEARRILAETEPEGGRP